MEQPISNLLGELKNIYVKIPLLQALHDVPIFSKTVRELVLKKPGRKPKDPPTVNVVGRLSELMMGRAPLGKYDDLGNPTIIVYIGKTHIPNIFFDLGTSVNVMTIATVNKLGLIDLRPTPTILEWLTDPLSNQKESWTTR